MVVEAEIRFLTVEEMLFESGCVPLLTGSSVENARIELRAGEVDPISDGELPASLRRAMTQLVLVGALVSRPKRVHAGSVREAAVLQASSISLVIIISLFLLLLIRDTFSSFLIFSASRLIAPKRPRSIPFFCPT